MTKPKLLDLFCGEGGASMGYHLAGFDVTGVDDTPMAKYPFPFIEADVFDLHFDFIMQFDVLAASPPCKTHTVLKAFSGSHHVDLIPDTRELLIRSGKPYIIENVEGAPLLNPITLCGSMFGLFVRRHRLFESNVQLKQPQCDHATQDRNSPGFLTKRYHSGKLIEYISSVIGVFGGGQGGGKGEAANWRREMQMPWASKPGMAEGIPPPYTEFIGRQLIQHLAGWSYDL